MAVGLCSRDQRYTTVDRHGVKLRVDSLDCSAGANHMQGPIQWWQLSDGSGRALNKIDLSSISDSVPALAPNSYLISWHCCVSLVCSWTRFAGSMPLPDWIDRCEAERDVAWADFSWNTPMDWSRQDLWPLSSTSKNGRVQCSVETEEFCNLDLLLNLYIRIHLTIDIFWFCSSHSAKVIVHSPSSPRLGLGLLYASVGWMDISDDFKLVVLYHHLMRSFVWVWFMCSLTTRFPRLGSHRGEMRRSNARCPVCAACSWVRFEGYRCHLKLFW